MRKWHNTARDIVIDVESLPSDELEPSVYQHVTWWQKCQMSLSVLIVTKMLNIDYYMVFFISYPLSALGYDISLRTDRMIHERGLIKGMIWKWHAMIYVYHILQQRK